MNPAATSMSTTAATAPFSYLVIEDEPSHKRGEHDEQYVQINEKTRSVAGSATPTHRRLHRLAAEDDERDPQGKSQERQEQLTRAHPRDHRREQTSQNAHSHSDQAAT